MDFSKELYLGGDANLWKVNTGTQLFNHILTFLHTTWGTNKSFFPGPQPCSIERKNFGTIKQGSYVVCEKTNGTRHVCVCTMFEGKKMCVLVTRNQDMYLVPINILRPMFEGTILDGELVKTNGPESQWLYMVYDCLMTEGVSCTQKSLLDRLKVAEVFVSGIMKMKKDPLLFKMKTFWALKDFEGFQKTLDTFPYSTDGIVLTPVNEPIRSGTHETMFKWKPKDSNTIDFLFQRRDSTKWGMYVQEKGRIYFESELENAKLLEGTGEGSIVECQYVHWETPRWWRPLNIRTDKTHPNNRRTFYRTIVNISEDIKLDEFKKM